MPLLDFRELFSTEAGDPPAGETFEGLVREIGKALGLQPEWSGRGADQGRDLIFTEHRRGVLGSRIVRWLVSCKDKAKSGHSVNEAELGSVLDKARQHSARGFLLATTTTASTGTKAMLDTLATNGDIETLVWDRHELEGMLLRNEHLGLVKRFLPKSYTAFKRLSSLPQALDSIEALVPRPVYNRVLAAVQTYQADETWLTGDLIWPHDDASAETIDRAIAALLERNAPEDAANGIRDGDIKFDAVEAFLKTLARATPGQTQALCQHLIRAGRSDGSSLYAYRFLVDSFEPSNEEQIALAAHLAPEDLSELYHEEVASWIDEDVTSEPGRFEAWTDLDALSSHTRMEDVHVDALSFKGNEAGNRIEFRAAVTISVSLTFDREGAGSDSFPGCATGYIDASAIIVGEVTVDTSSRFEDPAEA